MPEAAETALSGQTDARLSLSARTLGAIGLAVGLIALIAAVLGSPSWMLLGTALVVWILCGWGLFFRAGARDRRMAALGSVLLLSAALAALAVLSGVYMIALGPSWIL